MGIQSVSSFILLTLIIYQVQSVLCNGNHNRRNYGQEYRSHYDAGMKHYQGFQGNQVQDGYRHYCEHHGQQSEKYINFMQCNDRYAKERHGYCDNYNNHNNMHEMLCKTLGEERGREWFGRAMGCHKANKQECFIVWYEDMTIAAEEMRNNHGRR